MSGELQWVVAATVGEIDLEDVKLFDFGAETYAIYRTKSGYYASDGFCTHEMAHLADGFVIGEVIECPLHQGRFDVRTGKALSPPVSEDLRTYPVRVDGDRILIGLEAK
jgi:3-phenylpropionate/trans-cinnamate dioxygenase ferredoxin subunit